METALLIDQLFSLDKMGLHKSCSILGDMMLFNYSLLPKCSGGRGQVLVLYANSLYEDQQYKRALVYYRQALSCDLSGVQSEYTNIVQEPQIKWKMYHCFVHLEEYEDALDILLSVPVKERSLQISMALAKLYHHFKRDSKSAVVFYRMVLMQCPFAVEAAVAMLLLGTSLTELAAIFKQHPTSLININWINIWLKAQEYMSLYQYTDAVREFECITKLGFTLSPEMNSQAAWCMAKLFEKQKAIELFKRARIQDEYILKYMDTYGRLLSSKSTASQMETLSNSLLATSPLHIEPWLVVTWNSVRKTKLTSGPRIQILVDKLEEVTNPLDYARPEKGFLIGIIGLSRQGYMGSIIHFQESIKVDPSFFEAYESLLRCYTLCRGYKAAFAQMNLALKSIKIPVQQLYLEAIVLSTRPETESKARECLENAVKIDKTFEKASLTLSHSYRQAKDVQKAIEMLNSVLEHHQSPALHFELGKCFQITKKNPDAIQQYELTLRMDPNHSEAMTNLLQLQEGVGDTAYELENDENEMEGVYFGEESLELQRDFGGDVSEFPVLELDDD